MTQITPLAGSPPQVPASPAAAPSGDWDFSFHNLLSIINPLQHLPIIGSIYRAITGDEIGTPERIAGDTLYGGLWGAVSGIADSAFQALTGKDFGGTVLALFTGNHAAPTAVAANAKPATPASSAYDALSASLVQKGVDPDLARRALVAYQKSMTLPDTVLTAVP